MSFVCWGSRAGRRTPGGVSGERSRGAEFPPWPCWPRCSGCSPGYGWLSGLPAHVAGSCWAPHPPVPPTDACFGWCCAICSSSCWKAFPPLPLQTNACMSACLLPSRHPWRSQGSVVGSCPWLSHRRQQLCREAGAGSCRRAPDAWGRGAWGCPASSWKAPLGRARLKCWASQKRASALFFKARAFWMRNLSPPGASTRCSSVSLRLVCSSWLSVDAVADKKDCKRKILLLCLPRVTCGFSLGCRNSEPNFSWIPIDRYLSPLNKRSREPALGLGGVSLLLLLVCWVVEIRCKTTGEDELNLRFSLNCKQVCKIKTNKKKWHWPWKWQ